MMNRQAILSHVQDRLANQPDPARWPEALAECANALQTPNAAGSTDELFEVLAASAASCATDRGVAIVPIAVALWNTGETDSQVLAAHLIGKAVPPPLVVPPAEEEEEEILTAEDPPRSMLYSAGPSSPPTPEGAQVLEHVLSWIAAVGNQRVADAIGLHGLAPAILADPESVLSRAREWQVSPQPVLRRLAAVVLVPAARDMRYRNLWMFWEILEPLLEDPEMSVRQAVAWVIRELVPKNPAEIKHFLMHWALTVQEPGRWVVRNVLNALPKRDQRDVQDSLRRQTPSSYFSFHKTFSITARQRAERMKKLQDAAKSARSRNGQGGDRSRPAQVQSAAAPSQAPPGRPQRTKTQAPKPPRPRQPGNRPPNGPTRSRPDGNRLSPQQGRSPSPSQGRPPAP